MFLGNVSGVFLGGSGGFEKEVSGGVLGMFEGF